MKVVVWKLEIETDPKEFLGKGLEEAIAEMQGVTGVALKPTTMREAKLSKPILAIDGGGES